MGVKCNIVDSALNNLGALRWGIKGKDYSCDIADNYIEYLDCPTVQPVLCITSDCENKATIFNCNFKILKLGLEVSGNLSTFALGLSGYVGGTEPFTYSWVFDTTVYIASGPVNMNNLILTIRPEKDINSVVTYITLTITDAEGCSSTKTCIVIPAGLKCNANYVPCVNPKNLVVTNLYTTCAAPLNLTVTSI